MVNEFIEIINLAFISSWQRMRLIRNARACQSISAQGKCMVCDENVDIWGFTVKDGCKELIDDIEIIFKEILC